MPLDPQYLKRLVALALSLAALALLFVDPEILDENWMEEEEEEQMNENEDFPLHLTSRYMDLLPSEQFLILNLIMENMERNASNLLLDAYM
ncbi:hypothetical protein HNY73_017352 [Argiope bruennichi]|uniref:Uncharacterized protein n=1 Tax=Argiope bruennichi TaxID=94029 RepID=A0A8T0EMT2_ARGBR|nr:hypothetical protein HNY73_017352 [Argiope bruennichi]